MRKKLRILWQLIPAALLLLGVTSSCGSVWWEPDPPPGWNNTFYDRYLTGTWRLVQANSTLVSASSANYLQFAGNGRGYYYYYSNGRPCTERISYWCEYIGGSTASRIYIQYQNSPSATMNYWFTDGNVLWMQWTDANGGIMTYQYRAVSGAPW